MASTKSKKTVSLGDEDRRYINESVGEAKRRVGGAAAGLESSTIFDTLESFGLSSDRVERLRQALGKVEVREGIEKAQEYLSEQIEIARGYARDNPKKVIGGAAGVLVGASLLALAIRRAAGEDKPKARAKPASAAKSSSKKSSSKKSTKKR
ncbi:MAG TPA: hypothetical protein VMS98_04495 [Thermoanaerobaculia bacterium]|nr:hypothetical protein [Thermoanaerobaculia bacterium]